MSYPDFRRPEAEPAATAPPPSTSTITAIDQRWSERTCSAWAVGVTDPTGRNGTWVCHCGVVVTTGLVVGGGGVVVVMVVGGGVVVVGTGRAIWRIGGAGAGGGGGGGGWVVVVVGGGGVVVVVGGGGGGGWVVVGGQVGSSGSHSGDGWRSPGSRQMSGAGRRSDPIVSLPPRVEAAPAFG